MIETTIRDRDRYIYIMNPDTTDKTPTEEVELFMKRNFPQIPMHGGDSSIMDIDKESGYVQVVLSGACGGCGISPMTTEAIKSRMTKEIEWVESVNVHLQDTQMNSHF